MIHIIHLQYKLYFMQNSNNSPNKMQGEKFQSDLILNILSKFSSIL